ncbi:hypothetical protein C8R43DRAFT_1129624 [Mycena crocata]|nr:hypothetical protein C8R43DRAFT_1129624 [Mycena crocata]
MPPSGTCNALGTALEAAGNCLAFAASVAQFTPVPYTQQLISLAVAILSTIQRAKDNKAGFQQLARDTGDIVRAVVEARVLSFHMKKSLEDLVVLLTEIKNFAVEHLSRGTIHRVLASLNDASKIRDYRAQIRQALDVFGLKTQISSHENILQILEELQDRRTELPLPPPPLIDSPGLVDPATISISVTAPLLPDAVDDVAAQPATMSSSPPATPPAALPPVPQVVLNDSFGNFLNCSIAGPVTLTTLNGDYTAQNSYQYSGGTRLRGLRAYQPALSVS